jgi:hypothetical protein
MKLTHSFESGGICPRLHARSALARANLCHKNAACLRRNPVPNVGLFFRWDGKKII